MPVPGNILTATSGKHQVGLGSASFSAISQDAQHNPWQKGTETLKLGDDAWSPSKGSPPQIAPVSRSASYVAPTLAEPYNAKPTRPAEEPAKCSPSYSKGWKDLPAPKPKKLRLGSPDRATRFGMI